MSYNADVKLALEGMLKVVEGLEGLTTDSQSLAALDAVKVALGVAVSEPEDTDPPPPPPEPEDPDGNPPGRFAWLIRAAVLGRIRLATQSVDVTPIHTTAKTGGTWTY